jgi:hypothetical protein
MTPLPSLVRTNGSKNGMSYEGSGLYTSCGHLRPQHFSLFA